MALGGSGLGFGVFWFRLLGCALGPSTGVMSADMEFPGFGGGLRVWGSRLRA